jgi:hypothetical protein
MWNKWLGILLYNLCLLSDPLCLSSSLAIHYSFLVHHPVNWDDRHLLARAMASDFSVALVVDSFRIQTQLALEGLNSISYLCVPLTRIQQYWLEGSIQVCKQR